MLVRHSLTATGTCPNNGLPDRYRITVSTTHAVYCEEIAAAVDDLPARGSMPRHGTSSQPM
jgi:hypothetical protein